MADPKNTKLPTGPKKPEPAKPTSSGLLPMRPAAPVSTPSTAATSAATSSTTSYTASLHLEDKPKSIPAPAIPAATTAAAPAPAPAPAPSPAASASSGMDAFLKADLEEIGRLRRELSARTSELKEANLRLSNETSLRKEADFRMLELQARNDELTNRVEGSSTFLKVFFAMIIAAAGTGAGLYYGMVVPAKQESEKAFDTRDQASRGRDQAVQDLERIRGDNTRLSKDVTTERARADTCKTDLDQTRAALQAAQAPRRR